MTTTGNLPVFWHLTFPLVNHRYLTLPAAYFCLANQYRCLFLCDISSIIYMGRLACTVNPMSLVIKFLFIFLSLITSSLRLCLTNLATIIWGWVSFFLWLQPFYSQNLRLLSRFLGYSLWGWQRLQENLQHAREFLTFQLPCCDPFWILACLDSRCTLSTWGLCFPGWAHRRLDFAHLREPLSCQYWHHFHRKRELTSEEYLWSLLCFPQHSLHQKPDC